MSFVSMIKQQREEMENTPLPPPREDYSDFTPYSDLSAWDLLSAGDISGLAGRAMDAVGEAWDAIATPNPQEGYWDNINANAFNPQSNMVSAMPDYGAGVADAVQDVWNNDIYPGIVEPFATGAVQAVNEWGRAQGQQLDALNDYVHAVANAGYDPTTGQWNEMDTGAIDRYLDASQYAADASQLVLKGPGMLIPQVGGGVFLGDVLNEMAENGVGSGLRLATYGNAADFFSQDDLGERFEERPITTAGEGLMSLLPLGIATGLGYKGAGAARSALRERRARREYENWWQDAMDEWEANAPQREAAQRAEQQNALLDVLRRAEEQKRNEYSQWWENELARQDQQRSLAEVLRQVQEQKQFKEDVANRMWWSEEPETGAGNGLGAVAEEPFPSIRQQRAELERMAQEEQQRQRMQDMTDDLAERMRWNEGQETGAGTGEGRIAEDPVSISIKQAMAEIERIAQERQKRQAEADSFNERMAKYEGREEGASAGIGRTMEDPMARAISEQVAAATDGIAKRMGRRNPEPEGAAREQERPMQTTEIPREEGGAYYYHGTKPEDPTEPAWRKAWQDQQADATGYKSLPESQREYMDGKVSNLEEQWSRERNSQEIINSVFPEESYSVAPGASRTPARAGRTQEAREAEAARPGEAMEAEEPQRPMLGEGKPKGKYESDTISRKDYFQRMRDLFGALRLGHIGRKNVLGVYKRTPDVARANTYGDFDTMWHEIGHKLDAYLGLGNKPGISMDELQRAMERKYGDDIPYRPEEIPAEGIAEFVKDYVTNPEKAAQDFPTFSKIFDDALKEDPDLAARMAEARDMARVYGEQGDWANVAGDIARDSKKTWRGKISDTLSKIAHDWLDRHWGLRRKEEQARKAGATISTDESAYVEARISESRARGVVESIVNGDGETMRREVGKIYGEIPHAATLKGAMEKLANFASKHADFLKDNNLESADHALGAYLLAERFREVHEYKYAEPLRKLKEAQEAAEEKLLEAEDLERTAKEILNETRGYSGRAEAMRDYEEAHREAVAARREARKAADAVKAKEAAGFRMPRDLKTYQRIIDSAPKELKEAAQEIWDIQDNMLHILKNQGFLTEEAYQRIRANGEHYIPLNREFPDDASIVHAMTGKGFIDVPNPVKKMGEYGSAFDVKDPLGNMVRNIDATVMAVARNRVGQKFVDLAKRKGLGGIVSEIPDGKTSARDSTFKVWIDGEQKAFETTPDVYQSLKNLSEEGVGTVEKYLLQYPASALRWGATAANWGFVIKNLARDNLEAWLYSNYGYKPFLDSARAVMDIIGKNEMYEEFKASGIVNNTIYKNSGEYLPDLLKQCEREMAKANGDYSGVVKKLNPGIAIEKFKKFMEAPSEFSEELTRYAVYRNAKRKGATQIEATLESKGNTIDFGRGGTVARRLNRFIPFLNVAIQGSLRFTEAMLKNPRRMALRMAVGGVLPSMALYAFIRGNDELSAEYDEFKPYEKNSFWMVPVPNGIVDSGWVRVPKPFQAGMLACSLPERVLDFCFRGDKRGMKEWAKSFIEDTFFPVSNPVPPHLLAFLEWKSNYNFFQQRDIVPPNLEKGVPEEQYNDRTSGFAKGLGRLTGTSPMKIDNTGNDLLGGLYGGVTSTADAIASGRADKWKSPLYSAVGDPYRSPQSVQDYYDWKKDVEARYKSYKDEKSERGQEAQREHKEVQTIDKTVKKFNDQISAAASAGNSTEERRLRKARTDFLRSALAQRKKGA